MLSQSKNCPPGVGGGVGVPAYKSLMGCAAGWGRFFTTGLGRIFTTGLTVMGSHFQFSDFWGNTVLYF